MPNKEKVRRELTLPDSTDNVKAMVIKSGIGAHKDNQNNETKQSPDRLDIKQR